MTGRLRGRFCACAWAFAGLALLALPSAAAAHAKLMGTSPAPGALVRHQPAVVVFRFEEPVEARLGAVRVVDSRGRRADDGRLVRSRGGSDVGVGLVPHVPAGTYSASYRVISDDGHVVMGGFDFSVGRRSGAGAVAPGARTRSPRAGPMTDTAFGVARGTMYLVTALIVGLLAFLRAVWLPALDATAGGSTAWAEASGAFADRVRRALYVAIEVGVVAGLAGIVLEGATATAGSFWGALDDHVFRDVTKTGFGGYWAFRVVDLVTLGAVLVLAGRETVVPRLRRAALGAAGIAMSRTAGPRLLLTVGLPAGILVITPALAGHAADRDRGLMIPVDAAHVLAMSVWLGGLAALLAAVPAATRRLEPPDSHRLMAAVTVRFSAVALAAVALLVGTGVVQALEHVGSWSALAGTGYGRAVLAKIALTLGLVALGALNRRRTVPALRRLARGEDVPGSPARLLRRAVAAEVVLIVAVLAVTAALVSYAPPGG